MNNSYIVKTEHFEGPLDVLLTLIEKRKLLINQVSLATVTEEFMRHIESLHAPEFIKEKTSFVVVASVLLLIKARSLLPTLTVTEEETEDIVDLERRLKTLEFIRSISKQIEAKYGKKIIYNQGNFKRDFCIFAPSNDISISNIHEAVGRVMHKLPKPEKKIPEVKIRTVVSIEEMMQTLTTRIQKAISTTFTQFTKANASGGDVKEVKQNVVVSFLALLELVKQNTIFVEQTQMFAEIDIKSVEHTGVGTPVL
ncbi:MAG: segregation/condensation protein A [Patescibacteria group bacterium]